MSNAIKALLLCAMFIPLFSQGGFAVELDKPLPLIDIEEAGEIALQDGKATFVPWSSSAMDNKVTMLQVLAASQKAADLNQSYFDQFSERFDTNTSVSTATIIVSNNIPKMFGGFVRKELKKNKKAHPKAIMVNDKKGLTREQLTLPETLSVMMLVDADGVVRKYHEGKLAPEEEQNWLTKIDQLLTEAQ